MPGLQGGTRVVRGTEAHHLRDVLRVVPGAELLAFDGDGLEAAAWVVAVDQRGVELQISEPRPGGREAALDVTLAVAVLKGDKLSDVVRKATELGVARVRLFAAAPVVSERKLRRYRRVAEEAAKQCRRDVVPEVAAPVPLAELALDEQALVVVPEADGRLREALAAAGGGRLTFVTGPEGGLTEDELDALQHRGARPVRLGRRVLRAETAPIALAAAALLPDAL